MVNVHVTHYDDSLIVRTIPFLIILAQCVVCEVIHHAHKSDRKSDTPLRAGEEPWKVRLKQSHRGTVAHSPFTVYNTTLLVYLLILKQKAVTPVLDDNEAGIKCRLSGSRNVIHVIHSLGKVSVRIEVTAKGNTE